MIRWQTQEDFQAWFDRSVAMAVGLPDPWAPDPRQPFEDWVRDVVVDIFMRESCSPADDLEEDERCPVCLSIYGKPEVEEPEIKPEEKQMEEAIPEAATETMTNTQIDTNTERKRKRMADDETEEQAESETETQAKKRKPEVKPEAKIKIEAPELDDELPVRLDACGHHIGRDCLQIFLKEEGDYSNKCPTCREELFDKGGPGAEELLEVYLRKAEEAAENLNEADTDRTILNWRRELVDLRRDRWSELIQRWRYRIDELDILLECMYEEGSLEEDIAIDEIVECEECIGILLSDKHTWFQLHKDGPHWSSDMFPDWDKM